VPAGFPEPRIWTLDRSDALAEGRALRLVACTRRPLHEARILGFDLPCEPQDCWRRWLRSFGGPCTADACRRPEPLHRRWSGPERLRNTCVAEQHRLARSFAAMVAELLQAGRLTADEAQAARPAFTVRLDDRRGDRSEDLPEPESLIEPDRAGSQRASRLTRMRAAPWWPWRSCR